MRFKAYGFDVQEIDGNDMQQFRDALNVAKERDNGKPQFIVAHTLIGKGIPEVPAQTRRTVSRGKICRCFAQGARSSGRTLFRLERDLRLFRRTQKEATGRVRAVGKNLQRMAQGQPGKGDATG